MKFKLLISLLLVMGLVISIGAVGLVGAEKPKIALFVSTINNPYFVTMADGAKAAAADFGADITVFDGQNDSAIQTTQVEDAIAKGYSAILLNPTNQDALVPAVKKANAAGIPVFSVDRDVKGGERVAYIGTSNVLAAKEGAIVFLSSLLQAKTTPFKIVILEGIPGASAAVEREEGFKDVLTPFIDAGVIQVIKDLTAQFDRATGLKVMEDILATTKDIDGLIAANDEMALGALQALKAAGVPVGVANNGVIIMGFDAVADAVNAVKAGDFIGTVAQAPFIQGYWGAEASILYVEGKWSVPPGTATYAPTGAKFIPTPVGIVTAANADTITSVTMAKPPLPGT